MVSVTARRSLKSPSVYAVLAAALPKAQVWEGLGTTIGGGWGGREVLSVNHSPGIKTCDGWQACMAAREA